MASLIMLNSALLDEKRMGLSVFLNAQAKTTIYILLQNRHIEKVRKLLINFLGLENYRHISRLP